MPEGDQFCGRGVCAANAGHEGTCAEASGWDEDWSPATVRALAQVDALVERLRTSPGMPNGGES